jgi:arginase
MEVDLVLVPYDSAHRNLRMGAGPLRLVEAGLPEHLASRGHETRIIPVELESGFRTEISSAFELAGKIRDSVRRSREEDRFPVVLAGNCISAVGTVSALGHPEVYWFDAHGDLNTPESTRSGFLDGMALSILLGRCWRGLAAGVGLEVVSPDQVWLIGARDLDPAEKEYLEHAGVRWGGVDLPWDQGPGPTGRRRSYLHIDLDVLDPAEGRANPFQVPGGLERQDLIRGIDWIQDRGPVEAAALTAYDPSGDPDGTIVEAAFRIVEQVLATPPITR